mmetsp:Transcript_102315/g.289307  ORF Transcript_102315/g.289307 Transcript_102315/m.289307 type:complete len:145 (+) Transcript_102315:457-891(+)
MEQLAHAGHLCITEAEAAAQGSGLSRTRAAARTMRSLQVLEAPSRKQPLWQSAVADTFAGTREGAEVRASIVVAIAVVARGVVVGRGVVVVGPGVVVVRVAGGCVTVVAVGAGVVVMVVVVGHPRSACKQHQACLPPSHSFLQS